MTTCLANESRQKDSSPCGQKNEEQATSKPIRPLDSPSVDICGSTEHGPDILPSSNLNAESYCLDQAKNLQCKKELMSVQAPAGRDIACQTIPDPTFSGRVILCFPPNDPENPYNWSSVGILQGTIDSNLIYSSGERLSSSLLVSFQSSIVPLARRCQAVPSNT